MPTTNPPEPRWPAVLAVLAVGALYLVLPDAFFLGPRWLLLALLVCLMIPATLAHRAGHEVLNAVFGHLLSVVMSLALVFSLSVLIRKVLNHSAPPAELLLSASSLWAVNILVFASWYWHLDAGGPHVRAKRLGHETGAFLFPQMTLEGPAGDEPGGAEWSPRFPDYLFLAFNTSTAFSPTDSPVLSRWAKLLMMTQSLISLTTTLIVIARAINTL